MKKILVVSGHPRISYSNANRMILERLVDRPGVVLTDVRTNYPDGAINVKQEQELLQASSLIVLQFPFIWYGMPSHFKAWMESVFVEGFAHGRSGNALKDKKLLLSVTLGGSCDSYTERGHHRNPVESFLKPLEMFIKYCGMRYLPPIYSYAMVAADPGSMEALQQKAELHARRILQAIRDHEMNSSRELLAV